MRKKQYCDGLNVFDASIKRIEYIYSIYDDVVVSFSGGKDSTAVLNLTLMVAEKLNKLPLKVFFFDEEAIHPDTIDYVERVSKDKRIDFHWYCLEVKHRNACSDEEPYWYCWDRDKKDLWVRDMPKNAITEHEKFYKGISFQELSTEIFKNKSTCVLTGIRTQESLRRYRALVFKKNDNYISNTDNSIKAHPIYDWSSEDVWLVVNKYGWDYNKTYDVFNKTKFYNKFLTQRVCPPFGEEPLRGLWVYAECYPEMWHKMLNRVKGVATAWRYANTGLYTTGLKPDNISWKDYLYIKLENYQDIDKKYIINNINSIIKSHNKKSKLSITEDTPDPITGVSWQFLCMLAIKGDFKGRTASASTTHADKTRKKLNIDSKEAIKRYGR